eukprot:Gb_06974 [translate_table: standard]
MKTPKFKRFRPHLGFLRVFLLIGVYLICCSSRHSSVPGVGPLYQSTTGTIAHHLDHGSISSNQCISAQGVRLNLHPSSTKSTLAELIREATDKDKIRFNSILKSLDSATTNYEPKKTAMEPLHPGLRIGTGNYIANIAFGTPPNRFSLLMDTGSDITWIQCIPCTDCHAQAEQLFDPARSLSYRTLPCNSSACALLRGFPTNCGDAKCTYRALYNDRSLTQGDFVQDTVTVGSDSLQDFVFGCGHSNRGRLFGGAAGLLGLGRSPLSFPSQTAEIYGQVFSYCLPSFGTGSNVGSLYFGQGSIPAGEVFFVPLVPNSNPMLNSHYYIRLTGISVGGEELKVSPSLFDPNPQGGGVIIDSGTLATRLVEPVYTVFRDAFRNKTAHIPRAPAESIFDTCYSIDPSRDSSSSSSKDGDIPTVSFVFENGVELSLPAKNVLIRMHDQGRTMCLAFAATSDVMSKDLSIIGSFQQQDLRVIYDPRNSRLGFAVQLCDHDS